MDTHRQQRRLRVVHVALQELKDALLEVLIGEVFDLWMRGILLLDDSQPLILFLLGERFTGSGKNTLVKGISDNHSKSVGQGLSLSCLAFSRHNQFTLR